MIKYDKKEATAIKQRWKDGVPSLSDNFDFYILAIKRAQLAVIEYINQYMTYTAYACNQEEKVRLLWCERTEERPCLHYQACFWITDLKGRFLADVTAGTDEHNVAFCKGDRPVDVLSNVKHERGQAGNSK